MHRTPEVEDLARRFYRALRQADLSQVRCSISASPGVVWVGTGETEWWTGRDTVIEVIRAQLARAGSIDLDHHDPLSFGEGDIAVLSDQPTLRQADRDDLPLRLTAVARCEAGSWRFIQWHLSHGTSYRADGASAWQAWTDDRVTRRGEP
jgi:adenylate cyclase